MAITDKGSDRARDIGSGVTPVYTNAAAATSLTPPAGASGAQGGCYDSAVNRNLAVASLTAGIADMAVLRGVLQAVGMAAGSTTAAGKSMLRNLATGVTPPLKHVTTATMLAPPAGGTGATAGGYDTGANRDLWIASLTALNVDIAAMRSLLEGCGMLGKAPTAAGKAMMRDMGTGKQPKTPVDIGVTATDPPGGGTGANAGGWSTAGNRNLAITSLTAARTDIAALRTQMGAMGLMGAANYT